MRSTGAELNPAENVAAFCARYTLDRSATWLVACSGGCDSTALAHLLAEVVGDSGGTVRLAYLDHGLRSPAERRAERRSVETTASLLGVSLVAEALAPGTLRREAAERGSGIEAAARDARYRFLHAAALETGAAYVATGHHADDVAETVLMRLLRGSGPVGLGGIPPLRTVKDGVKVYTIARPLIGLTRHELQRFCSDRGIEWAEDLSNATDDYQRNRVRRSVMPALYECTPGAARLLSRAAGKIREVEAALEQLARELVTWHRDEECVVTDAAAFLRRPAALRRAALYQAAEMVRQTAAGFNPGASEGGGRIPGRFFAPLLRREGAGAITGRSADGLALYLRGYGLSIRIEGNRLQLAPDIVRHPKKGYLVEVGQQFTQEAEFSVIVEFALPTGAKAVVIGATGLQPPLVVRSRRAGDRITLPFGRKSLKKLFNELKVAEDQRSEIPVVEDRQGVVAVLCAGLGGRDLFRVGIEPLDRPPGAVIHCRWRGEEIFEEFAPRSGR